MACYGGLQHLCCWAEYVWTSHCNFPHSKGTAREKTGLWTEHCSLPWRICDRADEPFAPLTRNRLATLHSVKWALVVPDKEAWFTKKAWTDFIILTKSHFTQVIPRYHNWHRDSHKRGQADATWPDTWHRDTREAILSNLPLLLAHIAHMCSIWQRVCS